LRIFLANLLYSHLSIRSIKLAGLNQQNRNFSTHFIEIFNTHFILNCIINDNFVPCAISKKSWRCWLNIKLAGPIQNKKKKEKIISEINTLEFVLFFCTAKDNSILCHFQKNNAVDNLIFKLAEL